MNNPSRNNSPKSGAAQTASIGDQDMMTFLFNDAVPNSNNNPPAHPTAAGTMPAAAPQAASAPPPNNALAGDASLTTPAGVPDPLLRFFARGESLMTDEDAFDAASLDALLNSVRTSPQDGVDGEASDLTATAGDSLGELRNAHAQAQQQQHEMVDMNVLHHHHHHQIGVDNNGILVHAQPQGAPTYAQNMMDPQGNNNNMFQPSQPISVSTGTAFSVPLLMGMDFGNITNNGGGLMQGFPNEALTQQQPQQLPFAMMPQQHGLPGASLMPHQVAAPMPQSTTVTFQAPNYAQHQQPQLTMNPWDSAAMNNLAGAQQISSTAAATPATSAKSAKSNKRKKATPSTSTTSSSYPPISEDESDRKKRRSQRNLREQERSHQITARISELRTLLAEAGVHFKPDRYSTLVGVVNYIKMLQGRTKALDEEHRKLIETISGANRLANGGGTTTVQSHNKVLGESASATQSSSDSNTDEEFLIFLQGIDYKFIFKSCGVALAITSVDGRFVDCNEEFLRVTEYSREELLGGEKQLGGEGERGNSTNTNGETTSPAIGGLVTVYTTMTNSANTSEVTNAAAAAASSSSSAAAAPSPTPDPQSTFSSSRPPAEVRMRKKPHLSLFNLLGREDMENVYAAMSRMLKAPNSDGNYVSSSSRDASNSSSGRTSGKESSSSAKESSSKEYSVSSLGRGESSSMPRSSSSDSMLGSTTSSSGNEVSGDGISRYTVDHWSGKVKHTRRKEQFLQLNISLVRTADGRPKFFNCALYEVD